jgi:hypothetical protein
MASEIAIKGLSSLKKGSVVLDPMVGSGTVVRHAADLGLHSIGFDLDPLAVLITRAWTTAVDDEVVEDLASEVLEEAKSILLRDVALPWIDDDAETTAFVRYWFGTKQRNALRKIAATLEKKSASRLRERKRAALALLKVALSRIIVTKDAGASLARDVSHSRPHKVAEASVFDVFSAFERSIEQVRRLMAAKPPVGTSDVSLGDARTMKMVKNGSVDAVLTSPPYLNAIDYMRGHRLALVWLGHSLQELREIRSSAIGSERGPDDGTSSLFDDIYSAMVTGDLSSRHRAVVFRYAEDVYRLMSEIARVLKPGAEATLVVGNSCLKGTFIKNSSGVAEAGKMVGLRLKQEIERELPERNRYLPLATGALNKRMRTETVLSLIRR